MGDRVNCRVLFQSAQTPELEELLGLNAPEEVSYTPEGGEASFIGVDYGEIPDDLKEHLEGHKIPYAWFWNTGENFLEGVRLFDGRNPPDTWATVDGEVAVSGDALVDAHKVPKAAMCHHWLRFMEKICAPRLTAAMLTGEKEG